MKTTFLLLTTALLATLLSSANASTVCPDCSQHAEGATLRDPVSCSHYYKCVKGRAQRKNCGQGFYFDERFLICNFAAFVDCNVDGHTNVQQPKPKPSCSKITTTCEPPKQPPCEPKTTTCAPPEPEDPIYPPPHHHHPEHCDKKPKTTTCAPPEPEDPIHPPPHHHTHHPEHCDKKPKTTTCAPPPAPEHCDKKPGKFNRVILDTLQHRSDCKSLEDGTVLLDRHHCQRYYICLSGKSKRMKCSVGQWYDGHQMACRNQALVTNCAANRS